MQDIKKNSHNQYELEQTLTQVYTCKETATATSTKMSDKEMQQHMELQLHEQYAINNNSNLNSVVVLLASMIAVFGGYAYMFFHSSTSFSSLKEGWSLYCKSTELYSLDAFVFTTIASSIVLHIMRHICIYQGYAQRREQFITFAIRNKYFSSLFIKDPGTKDHHKEEKLSSDGIFPEGYHPFGKDCYEDTNCSCFAHLFRIKPGTNYLRPIQGLFGEFVKIFNRLQIVLVIGLCIKVMFNIIPNFSAGLNILGIIEVFSTIISLIILYICYKAYLSTLHEKYKDLEDEQYKKINPTNKNNKE